MKRLIIKKLIVISQSESRSLEVPFKKGLNIILGSNKTGKSSIIKSIFYTLGCECKKVESDWKKLISTYLLFWDYGDRSFCVCREGKQFRIFEVQDDKFVEIINTFKFSTYSNCLMDILEINLPCISIHGEQSNVTPPIILRFQYIDQDEGWSKIAESFNNVGYIKDWKGNTNKYVCGYMDETYYELKTQIAEFTLQKDEKIKERDYNQGLISHIASSIIQPDGAESIETITAKIDELLLKAEELKKEDFSIKNEIAVLENELYINQHKKKLLEQNLLETQKDIEYAMNKEDTLICPVCGMTYSNSLNEQLNITSDYVHCEKLYNELENQLSDTTNKLLEFQKKHKGILSEIQFADSAILKSKELLSYSSFYKNKGQCEIYESCKSHLDSIQTEINSLVSKIATLNIKIKEKESRKRLNEIKSKIIVFCQVLADKINVPKTFIRLKDFVQVIDRTGSETPRLVYMYQTALYLYNLERSHSPFNFLVIDTPNQQGQDENNLGSIFKSLELFLSDDGQVIVGTERPTGLEKKASNVITLTEKRRCLNDSNFQSHLELLKKLNEVSTNQTPTNDENDSK